MELRKQMDFILKPFGQVARNVFCIGRNYAQHAAELGNPIPAEPVVFLKPTSALCHSGWSVDAPPSLGRVDPEVEVVVAMAGGGRDIAEAHALDFISGLAVGLDMTARDLQADAKKKGLPWTLAKGRDGFAPVGEFATLKSLGPGPWNFSLRVNGELRQQGSTDQMLFSIPRLVHLLSQVFTLSPGDLIFTGTPAGVGAVSTGDKLYAELVGAPALEVAIR